VRTQQLRSAFVLRSTVADTAETAERDAATPEQVDAAVANPTAGTIAANAETEQRGGGGRGRQGQSQGRGGGGGGRGRAPRVPIESIQVGQELEGIVVRALTDPPLPDLAASWNTGRESRALVPVKVPCAIHWVMTFLPFVVCSAYARPRCAAEKRCRLRLLRGHRLREGRPRPHLAAVGEPSASIAAAHHCVARCCTGVQL